MWVLFHPLADAALLLGALAFSLWVWKLGPSLWRAPLSLFDRIAASPTRSCLIVAALAFVGSAAVTLLWEFPQPGVHDEFSYLLGADTFLEGRLSNPSHPMWRHFESMHILQQPTYASRYPPAQGLIMAVGELLGGHPIVGVWLSAALGCGAICWMLMAWLPPRWALFGSLLAVLRIGIGGYWSQSYFGGWVAALGGALLFGGLRRTLDRPRIASSLAMALGLAILANSRPFEGFVVAVPCGLLVGGFVGYRTLSKQWGSVLRIVVPVCFAMVATALWMGSYNRAVTGDPMKMPHRLYAETYMTVPYFLFLPPRPQPRYRHAELAKFHKQFEKGSYQTQRSLRGWREQKLGAFASLWKLYLGVALGLALLFLPLSRGDPWVLFAILVSALFLGATSVTTWSMPHYSAPVASLVFFLVAQGVRSAFESRRWNGVGRHLLAALPLYCLGSLIYGLMNPQELWSWSEPSHFETRRAQILEDLEADNDRHLIIVHYGVRHRLHDEWVYNGADIDGAKVVWARALRPARNRELLEYFKDRRA
ncbi:MAG: hypothetical protein WBP34_01485, partial [Thermoanaerobaculia bacterium]